MKQPLFAIDQTDNRNAFLADALAQEGYDVVRWHSDTDRFPPQADRPYAIVFSPAKLIAETVAASIPPKSYVFGGNATPGALEWMAENGIVYVNFLDDELFTMLNAIPTAEGALMLAMEHTPATVRGMEVLLLGYGRAAKCVNQVFAALGANVTVLARSTKDRAEASIFAHAARDFDALEGRIAADVVINTVPHLVLTRDALRHLKQDAYVIDLASKPGGVDFEAAKELGIKTEHALGLPGKVAPKTAGDYMKRIILKTLAHRERNDHYG